MKNKIFLSLILVFAAIFQFALAGSKVFANSTVYDEAVIYFNEACGMCADYVERDLPEMLEGNDISSHTRKDYINEKGARKEMNKLAEKMGIPLELQSHIMTFIGEKYVIGGHVPKHLIDYVFDQENSEKFKRIILYQDKMHGEETDYKVYAVPYYSDDYAGEIKTYPINESLDPYFAYLGENKDKFMEEKGSGPVMNNHSYLLPVVLVSGFLDGINPCAFAVLLFFIAFLFSIKRTKANIWKMGMVYVFAIFLAYLFIGFGLLKAVMFADAPHFMAKLGAWLVIGLGVINLISYIFPNSPVKMKIPEISKPTIKNWMAKGTIPAAFVLGFLVGLCTFPCSGGIYVAIIGLLSAKTTYWMGFSYLILYNIVFVLPLIIILLLSSNKYAVEKLTSWEKSESKNMKLLSSVVMIALGLAILIWFT